MPTVAALCSDLSWLLTFSLLGLSLGIIEIRILSIITATNNIWFQVSRPWTRLGRDNNETPFAVIERRRIKAGKRTKSYQGTGLILQLFKIVFSRSNFSEVMNNSKLNLIKFYKNLIFFLKNFPLYLNCFNSKLRNIHKWE